MIKTKSFIIGTWYNIFILTVAAMLLISGIILSGLDSTWLSNDATADSLCDTLLDGNSVTTITFSSGGGSDTSAKLSLPKGSDILAATFDVSSFADSQDSYPSRVMVDVGDDGDLEWEFNLSSIGAMGKQTEFIGPIQNKFIVL